MLKTELLQEKIISLLEPGIYKTTAQVIEEFRMEHPLYWRMLEKEGEMLYGGGCSSVQQPATRISQALQSLPPGQIICLRENDICRWSTKQYRPGH